MLYAVTVQLPHRRPVHLCIGLLYAAWVGCGIWKWQSGAIWAFPFISHGSIAAILLFGIVTHLSLRNNYNDRILSDCARFLLRACVTVASLGGGLYSFVSRPIIYHFGIQSALALLDLTQWVMGGHWQFLKDRSEVIEADPNQRRSGSQNYAALA